MPGLICAASGRAGRARSRQAEGDAGHWSDLREDEGVDIHIGPLQDDGAYAHHLALLQRWRDEQTQLSVCLSAPLQLGLLWETGAWERYIIITSGGGALGTLPARVVAALAVAEAVLPEGQADQPLTV